MSLQCGCCVACAIIALILQNGMSAFATVNLIVTFHSKHWQSVIFQHLTANISCSVNLDFVWRYNPAAISLPTEYGLIKISSNSREVERFKSCIFEQSKLVKRIDIDRLPSTRTVLSINTSEEYIDTHDCCSFNEDIDEDNCSYSNQQTDNDLHSYQNQILQHSLLGLGDLPHAYFPL